MAYYTTWDDLPYIIQNKKWGQWGLPLTPTATRDAELAFHARRAYAIINSKLAPRYGSHLPFTSATLPELVKAISLDLTLYFIPATQQATGESYQRNYDNAMDLLQSIADRELDVYDDTNDQLLTEYDSDYGVDSNITYDADTDAGEDYLQWPDSVLQKRPGIGTKTSWEED